ncbi:MAG: hypothetical protein PHV85_01305 [Desulfovibrionaceae bacterium]|nr:hypothetical protein [Desulfovibrionaceae bacterium]MDD4951162.1 hypothetical protein [Desulfovibrionaceae bacterium]
MAKIHRLPGRGCRFYQKGRCLYEETLNPGLNRDWRCRVLLAWETAYDDFLGQAEAFSLGRDAAVALWERRFQRLVDLDCECPDYLCLPGADLPGCAHALGELCLKALPECPGQCRHYQAADFLA